MANIGIDLGTTNSLVAVVLSGKARCLLDDDGSALLPSAVRFEGEAYAVGLPALRRSGQTEGVTFSSFKRFMGRSPAEVRDEARLFHYDLLEDDDRVVRFRAGDLVFTPVELSAMVLRELKARAEECLLTPAGGAVITVPAYFDDAQRQATRDAARLAGLEVLRLLNEPTAAALAYGLESGGNGRKVAVYDLGGGTFDISILELDDGLFQVLSTAGDTRLGGDDFDHAIAEIAMAAAGLDEVQGVEWRELVRAAEAAKRQLSDVEEATVEAALTAGPLTMPLSRESFEAIIRPIVERTGEACRRALSDAKLEPSDIDEVVMVGGSTRVPLVRAFVGELFGRTPHIDVDPDQVVAIGAAMQADILSGKSEIAQDMLLLDILPLSLGIEMMGGVTERIIPRCSAIPSSATSTFTTHVDGQTAVDIHVVQGEREMVRDNRSLARFRLGGLPAMPAGVPRIKVEFAVDADGILKVTAREETSGRSSVIEVTPSYGLSDDEIEQMLDDAIDNAETDFDERLLIDARVEADQVINSVLGAVKAETALLEDGEAERFQAGVERLRQVIAGTDRKAISDATKQLDELTAPFAQRRIERDLGLALTGHTADDVAGKLGI
jgi:molecular chaperone HscA